MTIELIASPWVISIAKKRTDCFFEEKTLPFQKRNDVISLISNPLILSFSINVLTIFVEPTDSLMRLVILYIKEVFRSKKPVGIRISKQELAPFFDGLNCVQI